MRMHAQFSLQISSPGHLDQEQQNTWLFQNDIHQDSTVNCVYLQERHLALQRSYHYDCINISSVRSRFYCMALRGSNCSNVLLHCVRLGQLAVHSCGLVHVATVYGFRQCCINWSFLRSQICLYQAAAHVLLSV